MKLSDDQQKRIGGVFAVVVLAVVVIYYMLIAGQKANLAELQNKVVGERQKAESAEKIVKSAQIVQDALDVRQEQLSTIEKLMAGGDLYFWAFTNISALQAKYKSVEIVKTTKPGETEVGMLDKFPYKAASFSIEGSGVYEQLGAFVADLENEFPYMRVQNFELTPAEGRGGDKKDQSNAEKDRLGFRLDLIALIKPVASR